MGKWKLTFDENTLDETFIKVNTNKKNTPVYFPKHIKNKLYWIRDTKEDCEKCKKLYLDYNHYCKIMQKYKSFLEI